MKHCKHILQALIILTALMLVPKHGLLAAEVVLRAEEHKPQQTLELEFQQMIAMAGFKTPGLSADVSDFLRRVVDPEFFDNYKNIIFFEDKQDLSLEEQERIQQKVTALSALASRSMERMGMEKTPDVWFYPASGFDLASLMTVLPDLRSNSKVLILATNNAHFTEEGMLTPEGRQIIHFKAEQTVQGSNQAWGMGVTHVGGVRIQSEQLGGLLSTTLGRMRSFFGKDFRPLRAVSLKDKDFIPTWRKNLGKTETEHMTHGVLLFDLGEGTAKHMMIYLQADLMGSTVDYKEKEPWNKLMRLGENRYFTLKSPLFERLGGVLAKGSQGVLSPSAKRINQSRNFLLQIVAKNNGLVWQGYHQNPDSHYDDEAPEVLLTEEKESQFIRQWEHSSFSFSYLMGVDVIALQPTPGLLKELPLERPAEHGAPPPDCDRFLYR